MALKALNSVAGFSVGEVANVVIYANTDISTANLVVSAKSNLNSISNVIITGGSPGYLVSTDGTGNLSFIAPPSTTGITNGTSNVNIPTLNGNVTINVNGTANVGLFTQTSLDMQANVNPAQANTYQLGNATNRWNNVFANTANIAGNISAGGLLTNNLYYANGSPWDLQEAAGSATQIQYNDGLNNFGASANFTYNDSTQLFTVLGNGQFNNANLGNLATANFVNVASNTVTSNLTVNLELAGNTANFSGNIKALNSNLGNLATANFVNVASNTVTSNLTVNLELSGNTANFTGNVSALNANLGNLATANFANISSNVVTNNLTVNLALAGNTAGFSSNVTAPQLISNVATGTAPLVVNSTTRVANLNVDAAGAADTATNASAVLANVESSGVVFPTFISSTANANYSLQSNTAFSANLANGGLTATTFAGNLVGTSANVTGQLISTQSTGTAPLSVASTTRVANLNVDYANVSDYGVVTTQTTGTFYPVFVNSSSSGNLALGSNSNISFNAATGNLTTTILNATGNVTAGTGLTVTTGGMNVTGNINLTGNFNVTGNLNYSNVTDLVVGDPLIYLGANNTGDLYDLGFVASYNDGTYEHTGLARNHVDDYWTFFDGVVQEPTTVIDWANATYPTVKAGNFLAVSNVTAAQVFATANITTPQFISNVATGTAPLSIQSTTRVANLNVSYANVSDFGVVTSQNTGTYYPTFVNSSSTGNLALASNSAISANLANGALVATTFAGNLSATNANATTANISQTIVLGNSTVSTTIGWDSATTSSISANQTIASISTTGVTGLEFLVKGIDSTGSKYSVATVQAVTDGSAVDYSVFGTVTLGGSTGTLAVNISGGFVRLQVTPASSNSTVWTTQVRYI